MDYWGAHVFQRVVCNTGVRTCARAHTYTTGAHAHVHSRTEKAGYISGGPVSTFWQLRLSNISLCIFMSSRQANNFGSTSTTHLPSVHAFLVRIQLRVLTFFKQLIRHVVCFPRADVSFLLKTARYTLNPIWEPMAACVVLFTLEHNLHLSTQNQNTRRSHVNNQWLTEQKHGCWLTWLLSNNNNNNNNTIFFTIIILR